ncbi:Inhibitory regulator protein BUD2/CLA2 [Erysiphe neolycopersici]|uniref:Inhibitory regulator protein BUD2/CLA2 n=1 Tax=Erysiphe neolycopersici TaxID=212602 RepID=A0A420HWU9_9PEZI|nr:Inhibitory regulator protein BUD2/CLA2 [Erysiphe neolycopersici]
MSVLSQARLAERNKEGRRESWLIGNLSRRRYRQESMTLLNDEADPGYKTGQLISHNTDVADSSTTLTDDAMETPGNRRHGLIFQNSPSTSSNQARTRSWEAKDNRPACNQNLSNSNPRDTRSSESLNTESRSLNLINTSNMSSNVTRPQPRSSNSVRGHSSTKILIQPTSRSLSDSIRSLSINPSLLRSAAVDAKKITNLMNTLSGRMRGEVEYQANYGVTNRGFFHIDDVKGSLIYEGNERNPSPTTVVADLRELEVRPIQGPDGNLRSLELSNRTLGGHIHFRPVSETDLDHWLAALLSWQEDRPEILSNKVTKLSSPISENKRVVQNTLVNKDKSNAVKVGSIIKVAKLFLWDSTTSSTAQFMFRTSLKQPYLHSRTSWRCVSCILQDNGQFKLLLENDSNPLTIIQLSQLSRCAIQLIDSSVLDKEFCIAIFPLYAMTSSQLSFFNPVYIASESRLMHEVWFCLLRAFTVPEIYGQWSSTSNDEINSPSTLPESSLAHDVFRIEKSIKMRIVEAKFTKNLSAKTMVPNTGKTKKDEIDATVGDYFVEVILDGEIRARTSIRNETKCPFWREECEFQNLPPHPPNLIIVLKKLLPVALQNNSPQSNSKANISFETLNWTMEVPICKIERGDEKEAWWPIMDQRQENAGEILLSIKYDELVVLLANQYQTVSELLHNFSSGLTIQISQFIPAKLKVLSELMLNIFQVSGYAEDWLTTLVEDEIDGLEKEIPTDCHIRWTKKPVPDEPIQTGMSDREQSVRDMGKTLQEEANLLFRGNSLLTQALDFHMRRVGKEYLEDLLLDKISEINVLNPDCEVDPSRISSNQDINKNWTLLYSLTANLWDNIASSAERCPPELRQILKYVRAVAEDRYGNFLRTVVYTSVSGFLFLRFFCPALMNPKLFGLLKDHPQAKAQRTLTLIAKSLQALANLSNFGKKESWMEPMNRFLASHRQGMKKFIDSVCAISAGQTTSNLPASYSTPITIFGRLPPISREGFPSLPYLIDHAQNFSKLVKLWVETTANNPKLESLQGELLQFHQLCLKIQHRADECLHKAQQSNQSIYKQSHDILESSKNNPANYDLDLHKHIRASTSTSVDSRRTRYPPISTDINSIHKKGSLRSSNKDHSTAKSLREQDHIQSNPTSSIRVQSREEWPLKGFLGGLRRRGKENGDVPNRESDKNILSASSNDGFD